MKMVKMEDVSEVELMEFQVPLYRDLRSLIT
jgi:hypothetical protein